MRQPLKNKAETSKADAPKQVIKQVPDAVTEHQGSRGKPMKKIGPRGLQVVQRMSQIGHGTTSIAKALRMNRDTFRLCRKRQPEVEEALARGNAALEDELAHMLLAQAREGNVVAMIYLTKARCGWREGEQPERGTVAVTILLPDSMSEAQYRRLIDVTPAPKEPADGD